MKIHLIRHGQTDWNLQGRIQGSSDIPLNEKGITQVKLLCNKLDQYHFTKLYCSKLIRARQTAQIISEATGVPVTPIDNMQEIVFGDWEGLTWAEVESKYPELFREWLNNRRYTRVNNAECYDDVTNRALKQLNLLAEQNTDDFAIVTHGALIMCMVCYLNDIPYEKMADYLPDNATPTTIDSDLLIKKK